MNRILRNINLIQFTVCITGIFTKEMIIIGRHEIKIHTIYFKYVKAFYIQMLFFDQLFINFCL